MAVQADLVLADGQATPVNKTFSNRGSIVPSTGGQLATWKDITSGMQIGFATITLMVKESVNKVDVDKRIVLPTLETISGSDGGYTPSPKVAYSHMSREQFVLPARGTTAERKNLLAFSKNMNAHAVMTNAVHNLEATW